MNGDDYTRQGEAVSIGTKIPDITLTPLKANDITKLWSWQKPYVENHFRKMCAYDLFNDNENFKGSTYTQKLETIQNCTLEQVKLQVKEFNNVKFLTKIAILEDYSNNTKYYEAKDTILKGKRACSLTKQKSIDGTVHIFDYEDADKGYDIWNITEAVTDIVNFMGESFDINNDYFILKACLS